MSLVDTRRRCRGDWERGTENSDTKIIKKVCHRHVKILKRKSKPLNTSYSKESKHGVDSSDMYETIIKNLESTICELEITNQSLIQQIKDMRMEIQDMIQPCYLYSSSYVS